MKFLFSHEKFNTSEKNNSCSSLGTHAAGVEGIRKQVRSLCVRPLYIVHSIYTDMQYMQYTGNVDK